MAWYVALDSGDFWFPAQVYNREHGHVGFMLSCYDAEVSYNRQTNTFHARYPPHGPRTSVDEERVQWERIRAPPTDTSAHRLHVSDCLDTLCPGDHVEVQWRRNRQFPYGWWYGVVGHSDICDGHSHHCHCHLDDTVWLEFNQYTHGSRWRRAPINRRYHHEAGTEVEGFYGGIRKLITEEEVLTWKKLWPKESLE
ncbi:F-box protein At2g26850 [Cryptomeria japonica]|uniref:F-box protein At2g26850 n=1 Tax=Cryptomeria japonica TaxID=3369 RepID=UPI0027D9E5FF|nr:F-box protein At2g26850 [Cryptomeria japonica]